MGSNGPVRPLVAPEGTRGWWTRDLMASIVVCLVALPLCMGIAIASGVPPALGLITGIVGGIVVGAIAGSPLQVSGPAAGLAVLVWQIVQEYGIAGMGLAVLIGGTIQLTAGMLGLGRWFRAVSPAVIQGMLAGIGALILTSQFHVMVDDKPRGSGIDNLLSIPEAIYSAFVPGDDVHHFAAFIGVLTIVSIVAWNKLRPRALKSLPGPLVGVVIGTIVASVAALPIAKVSVPSDLTAAMTWVSGDALDLLSVGAFWSAAIGLALIASAETLLCATAVDRMHDGPRTNYDKELRAQGVGNMLCGAVGALPMTGVIVRSSANVDAGGKTRMSAILHGVWILVLVVLLPSVLAAVPTSSLAAVLVYTGYKLLNIQAVRKLYAAGGWTEPAIWGATLVAIVATDLLTGVLLGLGLAVVRLLAVFVRLDVSVTSSGTRHDVYLRGSATFVTLPKLAAAIEGIPDDATEVHFHLDNLAYIDHACFELIDAWKARHRGEVILETDTLRKRNHDRALMSSSAA